MAAAVSVQRSDGGGLIIFDGAQVGGSRQAPTSTSPAVSYILSLEGQPAGTKLHVGALKQYLDSLFAMRAASYKGQALSGGVVTAPAEPQAQLEVYREVLEQFRALLP